MLAQRAIKLILLAAMLVAATSASALDQVTLQLKWTHAFQFAGYYAAKELGYYREAGLEVRIEEGRPGFDPVNNVLEGKADFGIGTSSLLLQRKAGQPIVVLASIFQHSPYVLVARQQNATQSIHDIIDKRLMLEPQADELIAFLNKEDIPLNRIQLVEHSFDLQDLIKGNVDVMSAYVTNELYYLDLAQFSYSAYTPRAAGIDFYGDTLFTTEAQLAKNPERVKAFRAASLRGWKYAMAHQKEIAELIVAKYSQQHSLDFYLFEAKQMIPLIQPEIIEMGYVNPGRWRHIADIYAEMGMLPNNFSLEGFLYDPSPHRDLTWLYRALAAVLVVISIIAFIAFHIHRINRRLSAEVFERKRAEIELRQANETIERALSEQGRFMDMLTHELKTPISVVRMALGAMKVQGTLKDHADRALEDMSDIIERCQQMDQLEQQKLVPYPQRCRLDKILAGLCSTYSQKPLCVDDSLLRSSLANPLADESISRIGRLSITTEPLPELNTDPQLLCIILCNLISNAIKYSPPEAVIEIHAEPAQHGGKNGVLVTVQNQVGTAGLPDPEQLFNKYYRSPGAGSKSGSGLGLYLARSITGLLGGQIAYSVVQEKVRFTLWIPC